MQYVYFYTAVHISLINCCALYKKFWFLANLAGIATRVQTNLKILAEHRTEPDLRVPLVPKRTVFPIIRVRLTDPE